MDTLHPTAPRLDRVERAALSAAGQAAWDHVYTVRGFSGEMPNVFATMANSADGLACVGGVGEYVRFRTDFDRIFRELVILTVAQELRSGYEWSHHWAIALKAGAPESLLKRVGTPALEAEPMPVGPAVRYARLVANNQPVDDALFDALKTHFGAKGLVDLTMLAGHYLSLGRFINVAGVRVEPDHADVPFNRPADARPAFVPVTGKIGRMRLAGVTRETFAGDKAAIWDHVLASRGVKGWVPYLFAVLGNSPDALHYVAAVGEYARYKTDFDAVLRELVIMTVAREIDCAYEWTHHWPVAVKAGASEALLKKIGTPALDSEPTPVGPTIRYARLVANNRPVDDALFGALKTHYGPRRLTDLTNMIGYYGMIGRLINVVGFELEEGHEAIPFNG